MRLLTEKQAWLALAESIYGSQRLPFLGQAYWERLHIGADGTTYRQRVTQAYYGTGLCDSVHTMRSDGVISSSTRTRMLERLERVCDYVGRAYLFDRNQWEPRVDLCITMYEVLP